MEYYAIRQVPIVIFIYDNRKECVDMKRRIQTIEEKQKREALDFVEKVFTEYQDEAEGREVRALVEEIRRKKFYIPELELVALDESGAIIGYVMFSGFSIEGRYEGELLLLSPAAVRTDLQRQHISKDMIEYGFQQAVKMGYTAVLVEGNPKNYHARGFQTAADFGILPGRSVHLPHIECLMVKELRAGALARIKGIVEYDFYETLG